VSGRIPRADFYNASFDGDFAALSIPTRRFRFPDLMDSLFAFVESLLLLKLIPWLNEGSDSFVMLPIAEWQNVNTFIRLKSEEMKV